MEKENIQKQMRWVKERVSSSLSVPDAHWVCYLIDCAFAEVDNKGSMHERQYGVNIK